MIELREVTKRYHTSDGELTVLDIQDLRIERGDSVALVGPSGSGKSTLLSLIAGLDRPTTGDVKVGGTELNNLTEDDLANFRLKRVGFIFQSFRLLDNLTARENILLPGEVLGLSDAAARADRLLSSVDLSARARHFPAELSGGEQQRVAIARAFMNDPEIILADEPTGNLDGTNGERVRRLLIDLNRSHQTTLVVATHDLEFASLLSERIQLKSGRVI